ncbi:uncharacterized protein [Ptychodera flava]|uniref:uncharacterized protein n=1 Tax=Ptychodera flava TaxID=63121 RepID=UPI00396A7949
MMAEPSKIHDLQLRWLMTDLRMCFSDDKSKEDTSGMDLLTTCKQLFPTISRNSGVADAITSTPSEEMTVNSLGLCLCVLESDQTPKIGPITQDLCSKIIETLGIYLQQSTNLQHTKSTIPFPSCQPLAYAEFVLKYCRLVSGGATADEHVVDVWTQLARPVADWLQAACIDHIQENTEWNLPIPKPHNIEEVKLACEEKRNAIYKTFHNYDFVNDHKFQAGISSILSASQGDQSVLQAKLFYFSKFHHKVSLSEYEQWLQDNSMDTKDDVVKATSTGAMLEESKLEPEACSSSQVNETGPQYPSSFFDLLQKIEKGEPLPGVEELNIQPTNTSPLESTMDRKPKPWQTTTH